MPVVRWREPEGDVLRELLDAARTLPADQVAELVELAHRLRRAYPLC